MCPGGYPGHGCVTVLRSVGLNSPGDIGIPPCPVPALQAKLVPDIRRMNGKKLAIGTAGARRNFTGLPHALTFRGVRAKMSERSWSVPARARPIARTYSSSPSNRSRARDRENGSDSREVFSRPAWCMIISPICV